MNKPVDNSAKEGNSHLLNVVNIDERPGPTPEVLALDNYPEDEISPGKLITLHFSLASAENPDAIIDSN